MLHAITQRKTNIYRRYLGVREPGDVKVAEEDELTALLLGPLALMPPTVSAMFWMKLLRLSKAPSIPNTDPLSAIMEFWPSRPDGDGGRIEPDLQVKLLWPDGQRYLILVELKWRAPLSGNNQLHRQWMEYLSPHERKKAWHVFIGRETSEALKALGQKDVWNGRLLPMSWFEMLGMLEQMGIADLNPWVEQVSSVLKCLGIRRFQGFRSFPQSTYRHKNEVVFWRGFTGFSHLEPMVIDSSSLPIFFDQETR